MYLTCSGFGCCGVKSIGAIYPNRTSEDGLSIDRRKEKIDVYIRNNTYASGLSRAIICVLTDYEIENDLGLAKYMKDKGFKLVTRFNNPSGSICNLLVYQSKPKHKRGKGVPWDNL